MGKQHKNLLYRASIFNIAGTHTIKGENKWEET